MVPNCFLACSSVGLASSGALFLSWTVKVGMALLGESVDPSCHLRVVARGLARIMTVIVLVGRMATQCPLTQRQIGAAGVLSGSLVSDVTLSETRRECALRWFSWVLTLRLVVAGCRSVSRCELFQFGCRRGIVIGRSSTKTMRWSWLPTGICGSSVSDAIEPNRQ